MRTEIIAGITTFVTMAYIIFVNPNMLSTGAAATGSDQQAAVSYTHLDVYKRQVWYNLIVNQIPFHL